MLRGSKEVAQFARRMVHCLSQPKNAEKSGWKDDEIGTLEAKLDEEYRELKLELAALRGVLYRPNPHEVTRDAVMYIRNRVAAEATDLGCVSMMITDIAGGLDDARQ